MGLYRDSALGLCVDITGPDGNVYSLMGIGDDVARQLDRLDEWRGTIKAIELMGGGYKAVVDAFSNFFPVITLVGYDEVFNETDQEDLGEDD
jgi:hypothetical protein